MTSQQLSMVDQHTSSAGFALLEYDQNELREIVRDTLGGSVNVADLPRIKVPAGGATQWMIPTLDGDEAAKTIEGVVILNRETRAFWVNTEPNGSPPDCSSPDGFEGTGNPGGDCSRCPMAQYDSGKDGRQACRQQRQLFMIREGDVLPIVVNVPPSSLKAWRQFATQLVQARTPLTGVITRLSLVKAQSRNNQPYAQIVPAVASYLVPEDTARFKAYGESLRPSLFRDVAAEDYGEAAG